MFGLCFFGRENVFDIFLSESLFVRKFLRLKYISMFELIVHYSFIQLIEEVLY